MCAVNRILKLRRSTDQDKRIHGRLTEWNDARGFGFITPVADGPKVFVHITGFPTGDKRPLLNDLVTYETSSDERGRPRAVNVHHEALIRFTPRRSHRSESHGLGRRNSPQLMPILRTALLLVAILAVPAIMSHKGGNKPIVAPQAGSGDSILQSAFANRQGGIQVEGRGTVTRMLPDDMKGSRHQRFIIRLTSGQTLLITHNIDIAPRVAPLTIGATVSFGGVYEWNEQGGVIHWTHHDPDGRHQAGWLECNGFRYQ